MAKAIFTNNATGALSSPIASTGATTLVLGAGQGALFPVPTGGNYFYATIVDASNNKEIVKVTDNTADTFTMVRAQEGTTARTFLSGCKVEHRVTAAGLNEKLSAADIAASLTTVQLLTSGSGATYTPPAGAKVIRVTIKGAGGGGSGAGTTNPNNSTAGGNSSFDNAGSMITAVGGGRGESITGPGIGGTGGSGTASYRIPGAPGNPPTSLIIGASDAATIGGPGGGNGGTIGGPGLATASAATAANGGGGGGASISSKTFTALGAWYAGFGGGEGETAVIWLPAASYTYTVGGGGSAGSAGASGAQGGQGGSGIIIVEEYY